LASLLDRRRRGSIPKPNVLEPIHIFTDDPEVKLLQGFVNGMKHISDRHLTLRHLKLIMTVYLIGRAFNGTKPGREMIAAIARLDVEELEPELTELVDKRYLSQIIPTYGAMKLTYKLGSMGGTLMRHIAGTSRQFPQNDKSFGKTG
jgi:hypothetical protein